MLLKKLIQKNAIKKQQNKAKEDFEAYEFNIRDLVLFARAMPELSEEYTDKYIKNYIFFGVRNNDDNTIINCELDKAYDLNSNCQDAFLPVEILQNVGEVSNTGSGELRWEIPIKLQFQTEGLSCISGLELEFVLGKDEPQWTEFLHIMGKNISWGMIKRKSLIYIAERLNNEVYSYLYNETAHKNALRLD